MDPFEKYHLQDWILSLVDLRDLINCTFFGYFSFGESPFFGYCAVGAG